MPSSCFRYIRLGLHLNKPRLVLAQSARWNTIKYYCNESGNRNEESSTLSSKLAKPRKLAKAEKIKKSQDDQKAKEFLEKLAKKMQDIRHAQVAEVKHEEKNKQNDINATGLEKELAHADHDVAAKGNQVQQTTTEKRGKGHTNPRNNQEFLDKLSKKLQDIRHELGEEVKHEENNKYKSKSMPVKPKGGRNDIKSRRSGQGTKVKPGIKDAIGLEKELVDAVYDVAAEAKGNQEHVASDLLEKLQVQQTTTDKRKKGQTKPTVKKLPVKREGGSSDLQSTESRQIDQRKEPRLDNMAKVKKLPVKREGGRYGLQSTERRQIDQRKGPRLDNMTTVKILPVKREGRSSDLQSTESRQIDQRKEPRLDNMATVKKLPVKREGERYGLQSTESKQIDQRKGPHQKTMATVKKLPVQYEGGSHDLQSNKSRQNGQRKEPHWENLRTVKILPVQPEGEGHGFKSTEGRKNFNRRGPASETMGILLAKTIRSWRSDAHNQQNDKQLQKESDETLPVKERLGIFDKAVSENIPIIEGKRRSLFDQLEIEQLQDSIRHLPGNAFEEEVELTKEGKMWKFPVDNEEGMEEEQNVGFYEHIFFDDLLQHFPATGPVRHFMDLVVVGLSKNPYITAKEKREHIMWFKNYFEDKYERIEELSEVVSKQ